MRGLRVCYQPKYPCFMPHGGHETMREADACFRSRETHDAIVKRDGLAAANARAKRHRLPYVTNTAAEPHSVKEIAT